MGDLLQPWHILVLSIVFLFPTIILGVIPFWFICKKAGYAPQLSLLNLVPFCLAPCFWSISWPSPIGSRRPAEQSPRLHLTRETGSR